MFKDNLLFLLKEQNKTYYKLANDTGIPVTTIFGWLKMNQLPRVYNVKIIADYFNVSIEYLLERENDVGAVEVTNDLAFDEEKIIREYRAFTPTKKAKLLSYVDGLKR